MGTISEQAAILRRQWDTERRWAGIERTYSAEEVIRLRGSVKEEHTLAHLGATRLFEMWHSHNAIRALNTSSASHAVELVSAGLQAIYLPGQQAATAPATVRRINRALLREDSPTPVVVDAEADSDGALNAFELMTELIEAGAAGVHLEDRLPAGQKNGQPGGKVLIPTGQFIQSLNAARLATDVLDVPAFIIARTAAMEASLLTSDADERDHEFLTGEQSEEGHHRVRPSLYSCVTRALAYAPYADLLWLETETPDLAGARAFAQIVHSQYPDKMLAYSCSPSYDWNEHQADVAELEQELAAMGYWFQFTSTAGFRTITPPEAEPAAETMLSRLPRQDLESAGGAGYSARVTQALASRETVPVPAGAIETAYFVGHDQIDHHGRLVPAD
jgi:isocitrate lyase